MLRNIIFKNDLTSLYVGYAWNNFGKYPDVDVFFIISKNAIPILKTILNNLGKLTHSLTHDLRERDVSVFPIWNDYDRQPTSIIFSQYQENKTLHQNRPFVCYMRNIINRF